MDKAYRRRNNSAVARSSDGPVDEIDELNARWISEVVRSSYGPVVEEEEF